jgi:TolA-binding protein
MEASGRVIFGEQNDNDEDDAVEQWPPIAQQEERLVELQRRKAELQADLARVQQENTTMQKATKEGKEQVDRMQSEASEDKIDLTTESGEKLQAKNDEMQQQVAHEEIAYLPACPPPGETWGSRSECRRGSPRPTRLLSQCKFAEHELSRSQTFDAGQH